MQLYDLLSMANGAISQAQGAPAINPVMPGGVNIDPEQARAAQPYAGTDIPAQSFYSKPPANWDAIKGGIFAGESGGDYDALFGFSNRPGGRYAGTKLTDMTLDQALQFAAPSGDYGQWVKGQVGRVATPMGAYQVVGTTLRQAKEGLGLTGNEKMTPELQDAIGQWIYRQQGTGAWEGYRGPNANFQTRLADRASTPTMRGGQGNDRLSTQGAPMGLFGSFTSSEEPQRFGDRLRAAASDGSLWDGLALAANSLSHRPDPGLAAMVSQRQQGREDAKRKNRTVEWMRANGMGDLAGAVESGALSAQQAIAMVMQQPERDKGVVIDGKLVNPYTGEVMGDYADPNGGGTEYGLTPQYVTKADGTLGMVVIGKDGTSKEVALPEGAALQRGIEKLDLGTSFQWYNSLTGEPIGAPIPKNVGEEARERAQGTEQGKLAAESEYSAPAAIDKAQRTIELIDEIAKDPALPSITGNIQGRMDPGMPVIGGGQAGANLGVKIDQLQGGTFMEAYETLKGGGQITEIEGKKAEAAIARLNRVQDYESYVAALNDLKSVLEAGMARARLRSGDAGLVSPPSAPPLTGTLPPADNGGISSDPLGIRQPIGGAQ